jgi:hypothetical protein
VNSYPGMKQIFKKKNKIKIKINSLNSFAHAKRSDPDDPSHASARCETHITRASISYTTRGSTQPGSCVSKTVAKSSTFLILFFSLFYCVCCREWAALCHLYTLVSFSFLSYVTSLASRPDTQRRRWSISGADWRVPYRLSIHIKHAEPAGIRQVDV